MGLIKLIVKAHDSSGAKFIEYDPSILSSFRSVEMINLPKGSTPFAVMKMTDEEIEQINSKTRDDIKRMDDRATILAEEYCGEYEDCKQLVYSDPANPFLEYECLKSGGNIKSQWLKCIEAKKQKALNMLQEEKLIAEKDGDTLASEEIDSLCELINEIDDSQVKQAESDKEALNYWPALLLPAPKIKTP